MASQTADNGSGNESTQNTQYDKIGTKYNKIKTLPATEPEDPSVIKALGDVKGMRCLDLACGTGKYTALLASLGASSVYGYDISSAMIEGAKAAYPASSNPKLHFSVADCSLPGALPSDGQFDIIFAGWFLNYAGTETELVNMFRVIGTSLVPGGKFVGITTNVHDAQMEKEKFDFYGLDVLVLDPAYVVPVPPSSASSASGEVLGIKARVVVKGDTPFQFDVFQFKKGVYERCAKKAGLKLNWRDIVLPEDERRDTGYWDRFVERATFVIIEATRL